MKLRSGILILLVANLGQAWSCQSDYDCWHIKGAQCYEDQPRKSCDCPPNTVMSLPGTECLPFAQAPNEKCEETSQCILGLFAADCIDNRCQCRKNYHYSAAYKKCIRHKVEGDLCKKEDDSCYQLGPTGKNVLKCINGLCLHLKHEKRPTRVSTVSRVCNIDEDCAHIKGAACTMSKKSGNRACNCAADHVLNPKTNECMPIVRETELACQDTIQCAAGMFAATCEEAKCQCWKDHHYHRPIEKCIRNRVFGDPCSEEVDGCWQLSAEGSNTLECAEFNQCRCRPFYEYINGTCQYPTEIPQSNKIHSQQKSNASREEDSIEINSNKSNFQKNNLSRDEESN